MQLTLKLCKQLPWLLTCYRREDREKKENFCKRFSAIFNQFQTFLKALTCPIQLSKLLSPLNSKLLKNSANPGTCVMWNQGHHGERRPSG